MSTRWFRFAALVGILVGPLEARAADLVLFIKGANASADFSSIDSSGCVTTTVHVEAGSEVIRDPNAVPPTLATVGAYLVITRVDSCLATTSVWQGFSDTVTYTYDRRLTQAHLTGTVV